MYLKIKGDILEIIGNHREMIYVKHIESKVLRLYLSVLAIPHMQDTYMYIIRAYNVVWGDPESVEATVCLVWHMVHTGASTFKIMVISVQPQSHKGNAGQYGRYAYGL